VWRTLAVVLLTSGCATAPRARATPSALHGWVHDGPPVRNPFSDGVSLRPGGVISKHAPEPEKERRGLAAIVVATRRAGGQSFTVRSDGDGRFRFATLAPGLYDVTIMAAGQVDRWPAVVIESGKRTYLDVALAD
jgi:hypothetical protein